MGHLYTGDIVVHRKNLNYILYTGQIVADKKFKIPNIHRTNKKQIIVNKIFKIKMFLFFERFILSFIDMTKLLNFDIFSS
jgi:hypothetical protein